jgi:predicted secreted Zn-dependent protease
MRTLVTFILRLWVDPEAVEHNWEGQVECVASGERTHVRGPDDMARFIEARIAESQTEDVRRGGA